MNDDIGMLYGKKITRGEFLVAYKNAQLEKTFFPRRTTFSIDQLAWQRLAILKKAEQLGITTTDDQIKHAIEATQLFQNPKTGLFDKARSEQVIQYLRGKLGVTASGIDQFFREKILIEKVQNLVASGALATEREVKKDFHLLADKMTAEYVVLPSNIVHTPKVTEEDVQKYYNEHKEQFRIPEKRIVEYIEVPVADYTNKVSVADEMLKAIYEQNKKYFIKMPATNAAPNAPLEFKTFAEAKSEIATRVIQNLALKEAINVADEFEAELGDESSKYKAIAKQMKLEIKTTSKPFAENDLVDGIDATAPFAQNAFTLTKDDSNFYSDVVSGKDSVYVLFYKEVFPTYIPSLKEVHSKVKESAIRAAKESAYTKKSKDILAQIKADLKKGTSFTDAVKKFRFDVKTTQSFDGAKPLEEPKGFGTKLQFALLGFKQGMLSDLLNTNNDEFFIAYLAKKEIADETTGMPKERNRILAGILRQKSQELVYSWRNNILKDAGFKDLSETKKKK